MSAQTIYVNEITNPFLYTVGSVTCFLNPKIFEEDLKTASFNTEELWQPVKDITVTPSSTSTQTVSY